MEKTKQVLELIEMIEDVCKEKGMKNIELVEELREKYIKDYQYK